MPLFMILDYMWYIVMFHTLKLARRAIADCKTELITFQPLLSLLLYYSAVVIRTSTRYFFVLNHTHNKNNNLLPPTPLLLLRIISLWSRKVLTSEWQTSSQSHSVKSGFLCSRVIKSVTLHFTDKRLNRNDRMYLWKSGGQEVRKTHCASIETQSWI